MIDKSKMTPKEYEQWVELANEARDVAEEANMMNEPRYRALYGDSSAPLPQQLTTPPLSTSEGDELRAERTEREERRKKYYNLRENERDLLEKFDKATYGGGYLAKNHRSPVCEKLMGDWWEMTDYGFIHAARGTGKSYFALALCHALTRGQEIGGWKVPNPVKVMYVDGEMSQQDLQKRVRGLDLVDTDGVENFFVINHDAYFRENRSIFCLTDEKEQNALLQHCYNLGVKVLILDNLSSLFRGVEENCADDWEKILGWLLKCRRYGISVVLIHHSGKNGDQRGTSRREDAAGWSIKLDAIGQEDVSEEEGAKFHAVFTKTRHSKFPTTTEWCFHMKENAPTRVEVKSSDLADIILDLIRQDVNNNGDIADHLGVSRAQVTKIFHKLEAKGLACKDGQKYRAGRAKREEGPVVVNAPPIEDAVMNAVKTAGRSLTFAEIRDAIKTVAEWSDKTVEDAVRKLAETGRLASEEIPNPKTGKGQKKTRLAYRIP
jgi:AAA domain